MGIKYKRPNITMTQLNHYVEVQECITVEDWGLCDGGYYIIPYFPENVTKNDINDFDNGLVS